TQGYADFRVVSALAELTPDRPQFVITYVVEEGPRYKFGTVEAQSELRDFTPAQIMESVTIRQGDWFDAKKVEDMVTSLNEAAGIKGYAFSEISPRYVRDPATQVMNVSIDVGEADRVYVERIDIQGNTVTRDKVLRREFRLNEGDAFNSLKVKRSQDRIQSLGFFQENFEIKQSPGSSPDQVILSADVEEKSTGELQLSAGYSSLEKLVVSASVTQRNFMGKGQTASAGVNWSNYSRSVSLGFTEPYLFDKQVLLGGEIYRRDLNSFNYVGDKRETTYSQLSNGLGIRLGFPLTEFMTFGTRYSLVQDRISLNKDTFFTDFDGAGPLDRECDPIKAGRYLCDELGTRLTSAIGLTLAFDNTDGLRATRGQRIIVNQDFAGLGGDVKYLRTRFDGTKYVSLPAGLILSAHAEGGYIHPLADDGDPNRDPIRITDRFFGAQMRGFDIRGIGPRIQRVSYNSEGVLDFDAATEADALGGRAYYMGRVEVEFPVPAGVRSLGLRPSAYVDVGSVWKIRPPELTDIIGFCNPVVTNTTGVAFEIEEPGGQCPGGDTTATTDDFTRTNGLKEFVLGNSPKPRVSIGVGVNWISPFGPLRLDVARAVVKQEGDDTKFFSFNVGTQF
nr:outer membrane protein assembly factor BamA [Pseudomonadota bacterium]